MAIAPTPNNNIYKGLVFDDIDSRDYGIYITGEAVFNSPERDVEMIEIPGRNGTYVLDKGRFHNIEVTYPAGLFGRSEADFAAGIRAFRNALASRIGYKRLEDDYNPDEYRMAVYSSGLDVTPAQLKAGEFDIKFNCKPQRFLKSGETAVSVSSGQTITNPTSFESSPLFSFETTASGSVPININDDTITFTNEPMGRVILASNIDQAIGGGSLTNWESLLVGDRIVIPKVDRIEFHAALPSGYFNRVTNCTGDLSLISSYGVVDNEFVVVCSYNGAIENVYGTRPTTQTKTSTITIEYQTTKGGAYYTTTATISLVVKYGETPNVHEPFFIFSAENSISTGTYNKISISAIYGYSSTQTLDGVVYFDLSIGEAYTINGGAVISINRFVNFGAELPKLKAGANVITYGQGVTDFKLVPKWWEV